MVGGGVHLKGRRRRRPESTKMRANNAQRKRESVVVVVTKGVWSLVRSGAKGGANSYL